MSRTVPFTITDAGRASERVGGAEVTAPVGVVGFGPGEAQGPSSRVRYDGPLGPIELRYVQDEARTRLQGPHVGDALVDLGPPATTDPIRLRRRLATGVSGRVGSDELTLSAPEDEPVVHLDLGEVRYALVRTGWFPRVMLSRPDLSALATFAVVGWRTHRVREDATPQEVLLAVIATRFAPLVAYRR